MQALAADAVAAGWVPGARAALARQRAGGGSSGGGGGEGGAAAAAAVAMALKHNLGLLPRAEMRPLGWQCLFQKLKRMGSAGKRKRSNARE